MVKTKGSKDKVKHRKRRSDIGKKRNLYAHKKTKPRHKVNGNFVPYKSNRRRDAPLKIWWWSIEEMSREGLMNFNKESRRKMRRIVYGHNRVRMDVDAEQISTREKISELALEYLWEGNWLMLMWSSSRNKYHVSAKGVAIVKITSHPDGLRARVYPNFNRRSLKRYWFWRDR